MTQVPYAAILGSIINGQRTCLTAGEANQCLAVIEHLRDVISEERSDLMNALDDLGAKLGKTPLERLRLLQDQLENEGMKAEAEVAAHAAMRAYAEKARGALSLVNLALSQHSDGPAVAGMRIAGNGPTIGEVVRRALSEPEKEGCPRCGWEGPMPNCMDDACPHVELRHQSCTKLCDCDPEGTCGHPGDRNYRCVKEAIARGDPDVVDVRHQVGRDTAQLIEDARHVADTWDRFGENEPRMLAAALDALVRSCHVAGRNDAQG